MIHMEDIMIHMGDITSALGIGVFQLTREFTGKRHLFDILKPLRHQISPDLLMTAPHLNCSILPDESWYPLHES